MALCLMDGNEAIARAAVAAGCRFFAGYPITPATTIFHEMLRLLPPLGGICLQGEDEIASMGFCIGAALSGLRAMTATSGPGISLYSEQISFAIGSEIPLVIVDVQRLGPSTGSATKGADGDVQFLRWGNSGGIPVIVLAPVDVKDCLTLTVHAFDLADRFRCPVFIASNKEVGMTRETLDMSQFQFPAQTTRKTGDENSPYLPYAAPDDASAPPFLPFGSRQLVRITSSTHGVDGYITTDPMEIQRFQERLCAKIENHIDQFSFYDFHETPGAQTLLITYGVTARAARTAVKMAREAGKDASVLVLKTLWPVPEAVIRRAAGPCSKVVVAEMNMGQYVREISRVLPDRDIRFLGRMNGTLLTPWEILEALKQ
ncbi:MAG: transketolase C-terminal domain-containing protein [Desulfosoma sp.]